MRQRTWAKVVSLAADGVPAITDLGLPVTYHLGHCLEPSQFQAVKDEHPESGKPQHALWSSPVVLGEQGAARTSWTDYLQREWGVIELSGPGPEPVLEEGRVRSASSYVTTNDDFAQWEDGPGVGSDVHSPSAYEQVLVGSVGKGGSSRPLDLWGNADHAASTGTLMPRPNHPTLAPVPKTEARPARGLYPVTAKPGAVVVRIDALDDLRALIRRYPARRGATGASFEAMRADGIAALVLTQRGADAAASVESLADPHTKAFCGWDVASLAWLGPEWVEVGPPTSVATYSAAEDLDDGPWYQPWDRWYRDIPMAFSVALSDRAATVRTRESNREETFHEHSTRQLPRQPRSG